MLPGHLDRIGLAPMAAPRAPDNRSLPSNSGSGRGRISDHVPGIARLLVCLATDCPNPRSVLANRRRDNQKPRPKDPRPSKWGRSAPNSKPTRREDHSATSATKLIRRSIGARDRVLDASHRSNRWALDGSPVHCHPTLARCRPPDPRQRALSSIPPDQPALLQERLEQVLRQAPIRESAT